MAVKKDSLPRWVVKRDHRREKFQKEKITAAVRRALEAVGERGSAEGITAAVSAVLRKRKKSPSVEEIQDLVEEALMRSGLHRTAKAYIIYRFQHKQLRDFKRSLDESIDLVDNYLSEKDWRVRENANMSFSLQGLNNHISSAVSSAYWLERVYPAEISRAHREGDFHIHDLQSVSAYCCGWDLQDLLRRGFGGVAGKIECRPPKHLHSALGQMVNFIYTLQGEVAGAQAFSNFDTLLAPFVRVDNLSYEQVKQQMQTFVFNMNVSTRVGFQTPFSNITLDISPPKALADKPAIVGGRAESFTYGQLQKEMDMINRAFAEVMMEGDAAARVFTFPIPTYNITEDFDWKDPRFEAIWEMTGKYGIPYFANFVNSDMSPDDARSMCCRLRLDNRRLRRRGGGLFGANPLTGSIGVVTINLPRLGFVSRDEKEFFARLEKLMDLAGESLEIKRKFIERLTEEGLYPYARLWLAAVKESQGGYWSNHFSTIGLVGMNEAALNLHGCDLLEERGRRFAARVLDFMRERLEDMQSRSGQLYNLEATPAEGTAYRLALKDKELFPKIIFANDEAVRREGAAPYYTNSSHLPVGATDDIFTALDWQDELQCKYTGGTVLHGFLGERLCQTELTGSLVRKIAQNYRLPYFTLTPTFSICPRHGYLRGQEPTCPRCGVETEVYSRVVGYLRPVKQWNDGKKAEYADRVEYRV